METILIVDDTKTNLNILIELLSEKYDVIAALDGLTALEMIKEEKIDLILLDIMMPKMDGYQVCEILKNDSQYGAQDIPVIFITAVTNENGIEKAYDVGGSDYITKPFKSKELMARVNKELQVQHLQKELKLLASTDPMTKLYNRRYFSKISEHALELSKRKKLSLSIIILDIDKFKNINDTYGHQVGDDVIITLANKLIKNQRKSDIVCRYGGEEFVLLLQNTSKDTAVLIAQKIRKEIESLKIMLPTNEDLTFTISLGVSSVDIKNDNNIESALKLADDALYEAKNNGRNMVCSK